MPSSPSRRLRPSSGTGAVAGLAGALALLFGSACTTAPAPAPRPREAAPHGVAAAERGYLLDPLEGYPAAIGPERRERLARAHRELIEEADPAAIEAARSLARD